MEYKRGPDRRKLNTFIDNDRRKPIGCRRQVRKINQEIETEKRKSRLLNNERFYPKNRVKNDDSISQVSNMKMKVMVFLTVLFLSFMFLSTYESFHFASSIGQDKNAVITSIEE